jgi:16S rRNA U516 pseudouridylate synthase RsuA-like enzyme
MSPRKPKIKSVLYLYAAQMVELKKIAERVDLPVSRLIREAIDDYLLKHRSSK